MPNWSGTVLTAKGLALQAKVEAGATMEITKLKIGDGVMGTGQTVSGLNDLVSPKKFIDISALTPLTSGTCKIHGVVTNAGVEIGFYVKELGVFAQDPDLGEILYAYAADGAPDFLPPEGGPVAVSEELVINLAFSNTATITANISMAGLVTVTIMQQAINQHNDDLSAHGLPDLYLPVGGGEMTGTLVLAADPTEDMEAATKQYADNNGGVNLRKNSHAYSGGDICYSKTAASYKYMECIVGGITAADEPTWTAVGQTVMDGSVTWVVRDIRGSGVPIGTITPRLALTPEPGELACDTGALVSRATYPQLWAWVQAHAPLVTEAAWQIQAAVQSSVGYYSSGDGATTFRLPRLVDFIRGSDGVRLPGTWQVDTLKSHTHDLFIVPYTGGYQNAVGGGPAGGAGVTGATGGSETRPKNITMLYCVKAFDAPTNQGIINITELANDVAGKVNLTDFTSWGNDTNGGRKLPDGTIMQWGRMDISGVGDSSHTLTYPLAFPAAVMRVVPVIENASGSASSDTFAQFVSTTLTTVTLMKGAAGGSSVAPSGIGYLAIGR